MRLEAQIEIENDFVVPVLFNFFLEKVDDLRRIADEDGIGGEILGFHRFAARDDVHEILVVRRRGFRIAGQGGIGALLVVAQLAPAGCEVLFGVVGEMHEVTGDEPAGLAALRFASLAVHARDGFQSAMHGGGCRRGNHQPHIHLRGQIDRRLGKRGNVDRNRLLHRVGCDADIVERVVLATMRNGFARRPQAVHDFQALGEDFRVLLEVRLERTVFVAVVAAARGEINAPAREQIQCRPLLGHADGMVQWKHIDGRRKADLRRFGSHLAEQQVGARRHTQGAEVVLAYPGGMHADGVRVDGFRDDVGDALVGRARVVFVMVVAEREIAETQNCSPVNSAHGARRAL